MSSTTVLMMALAVCLQGCTERNPVFNIEGDGAPGTDGPTIRSDGGPDPDVSLNDAAIENDLPPNAGCESAMVRFVLEVHSGGRPGRYCHDICQNWVHIRDKAGEPRNLPNMMDCIPSCSGCVAQPCPGMACMANPIGEPLVQTWTGFYVVGGMCGEGIHCAEARCAPPGKYVATMCASRNMASPALGECVPAMPATCVEVPFVLPESGTVEVRGKLPAIQ